MLFPPFCCDRGEILPEEVGNHGMGNGVKKKRKEKEKER